MNSAIRDIKTFVNTELAGLKGPAKQFAGQCTLSSPEHDLVLTKMAEFMGTTGRMGGGIVRRRRPSASWRLSDYGRMERHSFGYAVCIDSICMY